MQFVPKSFKLAIIFKLNGTLSIDGKNIWYSQEVGAIADKRLSAEKSVCLKRCPQN